MLSDEEKKEYEELKSLLYTGTISQYGKRKLIDIIEKQSKEIEKLNIIADKYEDLKIFYEDNICELEKQSREIKKLKEKLEFLNKEKRKKYENRR